MKPLRWLFTLLLLASPLAAQTVDTTNVRSDRQLRQAYGHNLARVRQARADLDTVIVRLVRDSLSTHARIVRDSLRAVTPLPPVDTVTPPPANVAPVSAFTFLCSALSCNFTDRSTDADGTITARVWAFGDGGTSTAQNPTRTYTAAGTYSVSLGVTDNAGATASSTQSVTVTAPQPPPPPPPPGTLPLEYSLTRPLLTGNPTALLAGNDWQSFRIGDHAQLAAHGFFVNQLGTGVEVKAALLPVVNGPAGARRAEVITDPTFGQVVRNWQTDSTDGHFQDVHYGRQFNPTTKAWYRVLIKYQPGFTNDGDRSTANPSWKMIFGGYARHVEWANNSCATNFEGLDPNQVGTGTLLPNSPRPGTCWYRITNEWTSQQWYEMVFYEERISNTQVRIRRWARQLTFNDVVSTTAPWTFKVGWLFTATSNVPAAASNLQLGINRNRPFFLGRAQWYAWGPWEVIDGNVVADPYGLASDML